MGIPDFTADISGSWKTVWLPWLAGALVLFVLGVHVANRDTGRETGDKSGMLMTAHEGTTDARPPDQSPGTIALDGAHLFGIEEAAYASAVPRTAQSPETALDLILKGIVATDDHRQGYAIIRNRDQQEKYFRVGDNVYSLATLEEIHVDHVILLHDGRYETLHLPIEFMAREHFAQQARNKEARRIVTNYREKLLARDGMALINMFGFEETFANGGFIGFTVKVLGKDGERMLEVLGVEEGDVITAVNGKRFAESLEAIESLKELKDATEVEIEIDREGVPMFFQFDFDQLDAAGAEEPQAASLVLEGTAAVTGESSTP